MMTQKAPFPESEKSVPWSNSRIQSKLKKSAANQVTTIVILESKIQKDILIDEMKQNPQAFFNFNFTADDYYLFLVKYSMMRAERQVIEQEFTKYLKEKKIFLE